MPGCPPAALLRDIQQTLSLRRGMRDRGPRARAAPTFAAEEAHFFEKTGWRLRPLSVSTSP